LQAILRGRLGFGGAIISDDLSMEAARHIQGRAVTPTEAVLAALHAGCDLALLCNQSLADGGQVIDTTLDCLTEAQITNRWQPGEASESRRRALLPRGPALDWDALMREPAYLHALGVIP
jgi:beta-N-acetylhexosaminidase